jgi:hypothetical protein
MRPRSAVAGIALSLVACGEPAEPPPAAPPDVDAAGADAADADDPAACAAAAAGIEVAALDLHGYPPYAVDGCDLAYVAADGTLLLRSLASGAETIVASREEAPRRPALAGDLLAWEATVAGSDVVRWKRGDGEPRTANGVFARSGEPRVSVGAIVFTGWIEDLDDADTDVYLVEPPDETPRLVAGGAGQQRFGDVSATHVALSDFSEDPAGVYRPDGSALADIVIVERASGEPQTLPRQDKQAFPMLGATGRLAFLDWRGVHPVPKLEGYALASLPLDDLGAEPRTVAEVATDPPYVRPAVRGGVAEWVERHEGAATLWRAPADASAAPRAVELTGDPSELFAPASAAAYTVLAARAGSALPSLISIER